MNLDWRLIRLARRVWGRIAVTAIVGVLAVPVAIWRLAVTGQTIARVYQGATLAEIVPNLLLIGGLVIGRSGLQFLRDQLANGTASRMRVWLQRLLYEHIVRLGPGAFDQRRTGDTVVALVEGTERLEFLFGPYLPQLVVAALAPLIIFAVVATLDLTTAVIYLVFAIVTLVAPILYQQTTRRTSAIRSKAYAALASDLLDSIQGLATLKAFGQSRQRGDLLARRAWDLYRSTMRVTATNMAMSAITIFGVMAGTAVAIAWGAIRVQEGTLSVSTLLVVLLLGVEVFRPLRDLVALYHNGMLAEAAARAIYDLLDTVPEVADAPNATDVASLPATVRFENVSFTYPRADGAQAPPVLRDLTFELHAGEVLGLVGPSGAGKSTIVNLLLRFLDPQAGRVAIGGHDARELPLETIRRQVAMVGQDTYLFYGSVADNLRVGKPDATQAELEQAARLANIHEFIASLPRGYDTIVGERGARLSGGQRQRIAIARALLRDAPILVLDEALSNVDAENEAVIRDALERLQRGRTTLVIAHRLSSVVNADRILVLDGGQIVQSGSHAELLAEGGLYAQLMAAQVAIEESPDDRLSIDDEADDDEAVSQPVVVTAAAAGHAPGGHAHDGHRHAAITDQPAPQVPNVWWRLLQLVRAWPWQPPLMLLTGLLQATSSIGVGVVGAVVVGRVATGQTVDGLIWLLLALVPAAAIFQWLDVWVPHDLAFKLLADMRIRLYRTLDPLAPAFLQRRRSGDLIATATSDVELIELFYAHTMTPLLVAIVVPLGALIVLAALGWQLAAVQLPIVVGIALTPLLAGGTMQRLGTALREETGRMNAFAVDGVQGLRTVVAFNHGGAQADELERSGRTYAAQKQHFQQWQAAQTALIDALIGLGSVVILTVGASLVVEGRLERAMLPVATILALSSFQPVVMIAGVAKELLQTLPGVRRFFALEDEPVLVTDGPGVPAPPPETRGLPIAFQGVTFRYGAKGPPVLDDVWLDVGAGETVALVGRSGAGKTTLAHLLLRFWDPQQGRILVDGRDLREYRLDELRGLVALVGQDTYLFNTTLRENLRLGRPDASDEEVLAAARRANVDGFASSLSDGYDTVVGERGAQLSGGQRQRVAIARALLKDAPVLVLDEATSHLDAVNEAEVRHAMAELMVGRTTLVIAHRLSTVRDADAIVVLDNGRVVERGTHAELLARDGLYTHLVASQVAASRAGARKERPVDDVALSGAHAFGGQTRHHGHHHGPS